MSGTARAEHSHGHYHHGDGHAHRDHSHADPGALLDGLSPAEVAFARGLRPIHDDVKLASLVTTGATLLFVQDRMPIDELRSRLDEAERAYAAAADRARALDATLPDERPRRYVAAIDAAREVLGELGAAMARDDWRDERERISEAIERLSRANEHMRAIGETFWGPEYVPSGSEGGHHTH